MYIFLDFDGVICTSGTYKRWFKAGGKLLDDPSGYDPVLLEMLFDRTCCQNVQQLCEMVKAEVVLSTSWREQHDYGFLVGLLGRVGITAPIIGKTPSLRPDGYRTRYGPTRGDEIEQWIADYEHPFRAEIAKKDIIILEDEENVAPYKSRQVKTSFNGTRAGFQLKHLNTGLRLAGWKVHRDPENKKQWVRTPPE